MFLFPLVKTLETLENFSFSFLYFKRQGKTYVQCKIQALSPLKIYIYGTTNAPQPVFSPNSKEMKFIL